jgi:hypothetical protein
MEAVQRAREAVEVGRGRSTRKRGIWSSSGDLKMVSLMEHAFVARQTAFASSGDRERHLVKAAQGAPNLPPKLGRRGLVQRNILADCIMRRALDLLTCAPLTRPLGAPRQRQIREKPESRTNFPCRFGRSRFLIEI